MKLTQSARKGIMILLLAIAVIMTIAGWFLLPDTLIVQVGITGTANTYMPKLFGLGLPCLLTAVFAYIYGKVDDNPKHLVISVVGVVVFVFVFVFNL